MVFLLAMLAAAYVFVLHGVAATNAGVGISGMFLPALLGLGLAVVNLVVFFVAWAWRTLGHLAALLVGAVCVLVLWAMWTGLDNDPSKPFRDHIDAVDDAVESGSVKSLEQAFDRCGNDCDERHWNSAFGRAAALGDVEMLRFIIARTKAPLSTLVLLVNTGFRLCPAFGQGHGVNAMTVALFGPNLAVRELVLGAASKDDLNVGLQYAVQGDRVDLIDLLVQRGVDVGQPLDDPENSPDMGAYPRRHSSLLDLAIDSRSTRAAQRLIVLGIPRLGIATSSPRRWTTVHEWVDAASTLAHRQGRVDSILGLLDLLATDETRRDVGKVDTEDCHRCSPMDLAVQKNEPLVVQALAAHGFNRTQVPARRDAALAQARDPAWVAARHDEARQSYGDDDGFLRCVQNELKDAAVRVRH